MHPIARSVSPVSRPVRPAPARPAPPARAAALALILSLAWAILAPPAAAQIPVAPTGLTLTRTVKLSHRLYVNMDVGDVLSGVITLKATQRDLGGTLLKQPAAMLLQFTLDGKPISPPLPSPWTFAWDSRSVPDGIYALSAQLLDGPANLDLYMPVSKTVEVNNDGVVIAGAHLVPVTPFKLGGVRDGITTSTPDWVRYPGVRPHPTAHPYPYRFIPPVWATPMDAALAWEGKRWMVESLIHNKTTFAQMIPSFYRRPSGSVVVEGAYWHGGNTSESAFPRAELRDLIDGPRNDADVSPYSTFAPLPHGPGWLGIDLGGRLFRIDADGTVTTLAGRRTKRTVVPLNLAAPAAKIKTENQETIGTFVGGVGFKMPVDLVLDVNDPRIVYVADTGNHRIARVDLSAAPPRITTLAGVPGVEGYRDGPAATALFHEPYSIVMAADRTLYVAEDGNRTIRAISPAGTVTTLVGQGPNVGPTKQQLVSNQAAYRVGGPFNSVVLHHPQVIRFDSRGNLVMADPYSASIWYVDLQARQVRLLTPIPRSVHGGWIWLDVDRRGNIGPVDDILLAVSITSNATLFRISKDGTRSKLVDGSGPILAGGYMGYVQDPSGHYTWAVAIDDEEGRFLTTGFGDMGVGNFRLLQPDDPKDLDYYLYLRGRSIFGLGTVPEFPWGSRPGFSILHGATVWSRLGIPNADDLVTWNYTDLVNYIQAGMAGSIPRPEITGNDARALVYFLWKNSLRGQEGAAPRFTLPPPAPPTPAPVIGNIRAEPAGPNRIRLSWTTDRPTLGFAHYSVTGAYYHTWALEDLYGTAHAVEIGPVPAGRTIHFRLVARTREGALADTGDYAFPAPPLSP